MSARPFPRNQILVGDVRERLAELPDASVECVITSPPYFAMRDYGSEGQLGAEATVEAWAAEIAGICDQLARVLVPSGSLFLNLGDGYSRHEREGAAKKSLLQGPARVALRLTRSGWLLRNTIVWSKPNPTPSSVRDRFTNAHEYIYFFTKQANYTFDLDAVREPAKTAAAGRTSSRARPSLPRPAVPSLRGGKSPRVDLNHGLARLKRAGIASHPLGKNPGDWWVEATGSYRGAHFASFPVRLVRRGLLTTCPERVCLACASPWQRAPQRLHGRLLATGPLRPTCACRAGWRPGRVLDPFIGSGTTAVAAEMYGRDWVGIELNPGYARLAQERLTDWRATQAGAAS